MIIYKAISLNPFNGFLNYTNSKSFSFSSSILHFLIEIVKFKNALNLAGSSILNFRKYSSYSSSVSHLFDVDEYNCVNLKMFSALTTIEVPFGNLL